MVAYFTKHLAVTESFEATEGSASKKQGYKSTTVLTELQVACVVEIKENKATPNNEPRVMVTAVMGITIEQQLNIKSLREVFTSTKNKTPTKEP